MAVRVAFENNNEVGVFSLLTNTYCLIAIGGSENFYSVFEGELSEVIPVVHTSIAGCRIIGNFTNICVFWPILYPRISVVDNKNVYPLNLFSFYKDSLPILSPLIIISMQNLLLLHGHSNNCHH